MEDAAIATYELTKRYKKVDALDQVSLEVPRGCCFGLLGPNGAGKSTLVKTLLSIVRPTSGSATMLGQDIRERAARRGVGYLPEGHQFPRYLSGEGVCRYFGQLSGLSGSELSQQVEEKLAVVGMTERAKDKITKYSKGMKQRVGLAQAMLGNPDLIFLDEPTDGVDPVGRKDIRQVIRDITAGGATVFLNSHLLSEVEMVCDHVAILDRGQIVVQGTVASIKAEIAAMGAGTTGVRVTFRTGPLSPEVTATITERGGVIESGGAFVITLDDVEEISPLIDTLRAAGVSIYGVRPEETSLEDAFIQLITGQEGGSHE